MCKKDISWVEWSKVNLIVGWGLLMKSLGIGSDYSVSMKVQKISYIIFFQRNIVQITVCLAIFSQKPMKRLAYSEAALAHIAVAKSRRKWLFINDRLLGGELSGRKWESVHEQERIMDIQGNLMKKGWATCHSQCDV